MKERKQFELFPRRFGFFPYIFLIYLCMPLYYISLEKGWKMALGYSLILLFLVSYRELYVSIDKSRFTFWLYLQIGIVFFMSIYYDIYFLFLGFFPANFIGWHTDKNSFRRAFLFFAVMVTLPLLLQLNELTNRDLLFLSPFIIIMLASPFGIRSMNSRMELERQLSDANEQIKQLVKREERFRIARDLHDTLGHTLSLLTLKSQLVGKLVTKDPERARHEAKEIERTSRSALTQVRELVSDMRTISVEEELIEAQALLETAGISLEIEGDIHLEGIPFLTQNILSMCLKEAVTNVVKHSEAAICYITIESEASGVRMVIQDDGKGLRSNESRKGNGLNGMSERLDLIDGTLQVTSDIGTKLMIRVPVIVSDRKAGVVS